MVYLGIDGKTAVKERKILLENAISRTRDLDLPVTTYGDKRSLFGVLQAVLQSCVDRQGDTLEPSRLMLQKLRELNAEQFRGVKTKDLRYVIECLFSDGGELLADTDFEGYTAKDVLGYLEICRRIFIAKIKFEVDTTTEAADEPQMTTVDSGGWDFYRMGQLKIQLDLKARNKKCAQFVISNREKCKDKKIVELARKILEGE
jgi:hypothetical protein